VPATSSEAKLEKPFLSENSLPPEMMENLMEQARWAKATFDRMTKKTREE
jgi:hypothetical protein